MLVSTCGLLEEGVRMRERRKGREEVSYLLRK